MLDRTPQDMTTQAAWSSSNAAVVTVDSGGVAVGVSAGDADITATYQNMSGRLHLTVTSGVVRTFAIAGTVTDGTTGGGLPNVTVQAAHSHGEAMSTRTSGSGSYAFGGLAPGSVLLTASSVSYGTRTLTVELSADAVADIVLPRTPCVLTLSHASSSSGRPAAQQP